MHGAIYIHRYTMVIVAIDYNYIPLFLCNLQMAYGPNSIFHTLHIQNSTHHFVLNTSCSILPIAMCIDVVHYNGNIVR